MNEKTDNEVYAVFCGMIDQAAVNRLFNGMTGAVTSGRTRIHLLFQSAGGTVSDGICLYNFFRALPIPLALYNVGSCASIAAIAYLGAQERKVSTYATFMLHRTTSGVQAASADRLHAIANSVILDDARTEAILREQLTLTDDQWRQHQSAELWFSAQESIAGRLALAIEEFSPPVGTPVFNV